MELDRPLTKDDLVTITDEDVYGSSVFEESDNPGVDAQPPKAQPGEAGAANDGATA